MKINKLFYILVSFVLFISCSNKENKEYAVKFTISEIKYSKWGKGENPPYYLFVEGTIKNISHDSVYVLPYNQYKKSLDKYYSYIYVAMAGKHICLNKIDEIGYLQPNEKMTIHLYSYMDSNVVNLEYLKKNITKLFFSYDPDMDSTIYYKEREEYLKLFIKNMKRHTPNYNEDIPNYMKRYRIPKDSADMHFVNKIIFRRTKESMHLKELPYGMDETSRIM